MKSELSGRHLYAHMLDYYPYAVSMQWNLWVEVEKKTNLYKQQNAVNVKLQ